ncbi:MAG TPA: M56 family metallopeptidase, partial [Verrucomicrobiales bacterium]|nr:M56 family metallopeptidase [Verrucomicrobiales bacterium]
MNSPFLSSVIELLGWVLVHFLWQAGVIALLLGAFLSFTKRSAPQLRYAASGAALLLMLGCAAGTLAWQWTGRPSRVAAASQAPGTTDRPVAASVPVADSVTPPVEAVPAGSPRPKTEFVIIPKTTAGQTEIISTAARLRPWLPWMVALWAAGVAFFSLRLLNGWRTVKKWRMSGSDLLPGDWPVRFDRICQAMRLTRTVRLLSSASLAVPVVIGWLKPVVLMPAALFAGLSPAQLEALLAHELAHVRRQDYLVNLLQSMVETLFFYHPAVWWVSAQLRKEREHCCDDAASAHSGGVLDYARALTALEEMRGLTPALGMSASGGSLLNRVRRLAGVPEQRTSGAGLGLITLSAAALALPVTLLQAAEQPFAIPQAAHAGNEKHSAYCVHDGGETHFILLSDIPFTSETSSGGNPKARTWHDDGTLTFDGGEELVFSRKSESPETLNLVTSGRNGGLTATPFDLAKGRIFLIAPGQVPRQLALKSP